MLSLISLGLGADIEAGDRARAAAGRENAAEHADGGRFARPVGPQETEDFAPVDLEADAIDGHELPNRFSRFSTTTADSLPRSLTANLPEKTAIKTASLPRSA